MNLERNLHIPELYDLSHRNDNEIHLGYDYKNNVLTNSISKQLFKNDITNGFLLNLQQMVVHMIDSNVILRNWFNFTVNKYYDRYNN
jgi:hypothetical protein